MFWMVVAILILLIINWLLIVGIWKDVVTAIFAGFAVELAALSAALLNEGVDGQLAVWSMIAAAVFAFISASITVVRRRRGARAGEEE